MSEESTKRRRKSTPKAVAARIVTKLIVIPPSIDPFNGTNPEGYTANEEITYLSTSEMDGGRPYLPGKGSLHPPPHFMSIPKFREWRSMSMFKQTAEYSKQGVAAAMKKWVEENLAPPKKTRKGKKSKGNDATSAASVAGVNNDGVGESNDGRVGGGAGARGGEGHKTPVQKKRKREQTLGDTGPIDGDAASPIYGASDLFDIGRNNTKAKEGKQRPSNVFRDRNLVWKKLPLRF